MITMRRVAIITIILILMILLAGCGQRVPTRNTSTKNPWGNATPTPRGTGGSALQTPVPTTTSPLIQATIIPEKTVTTTPVATYRSQPQVSNATANMTLIDKKKMPFSYNRTAYNLELENPPLLIEYTLTVPTVTRTGVEKDPTRAPTENDPNPTRPVTITYPDPTAWFEVTALNTDNKQVIAREGYGRQYDVRVSKQVWVRYPGSYYIEFAGNRLTADVEFWIPNAS
ncbi:MAG: hypothetical protein LUO97_05470 [Methanomicrobiales archaeon]|nr:hypothetical protein [Methanomicrobiales archaeon]